jgi:hypothetical protein
VTPRPCWGSRRTLRPSSTRPAPPATVAGGCVRLTQKWRFRVTTPNAEVRLSALAANTAPPPPLAPIKSRGGGGVLRNRLPPRDRPDDPGGDLGRHAPPGADYALASTLAWHPRGLRRLRAVSRESTTAYKPSTRNNLAGGIAMYWRNRSGRDRDSQPPLPTLPAMEAIWFPFTIHTNLLGWS